MKKVVNQNVCQVIVAGDVCIGCGICAAVCPVNVLEMHFNAYGEFIPVVSKSGCLACPVCLQACPFWNQGDDESSLAESLFGNESKAQHRFETGYYLNCLVGYVSDLTYRTSRSSGGLATWLQQAYLDKGLADYVIGVIPSEDPDRLFRYAVMDKKEEVSQSAKSAYYPVEMANVIKHVIEIPGRYIITGVPCFLKGVRLAMRHNTKLRQRIVCTIGLTCGQAKSKYFSQYLIALSGGNPSDIQKVDFRHKDPARSAIEYAFVFENRENDGSGPRMAICNPEIRKRIWNRSYFKPKACNYCDDVFAEVADMVCMDAWLPEYIRDWRGHNIVLVRSSQVLAIIKEGIEKGQLTLEEISIDQAIKSQRGVLTEKREILANRLYLHTKGDYTYIPQKRVKAKKPTLINRWKLYSQERMRSLSRQEFYLNCDQQDVWFINRFQIRMVPSLVLSMIIQNADRLVRRLLTKSNR